MADVVFAATTEVVQWSEPTAVLSVGGVVTTDGWRAWVTEIDGTQVEEVIGCNLGTISEKLSSTASFDLSVPKASAVAAEMSRVTREVQVYRNGGNPLFVGPFLQRSASSNAGEMGISCADVSWYLTRRYGSGFDTGNLLINPAFNDDFARWTKSGAVSLDSEHETGSQSAKFTGTASSYLRQTVQFTPKGRYRALLEARVKVSAGSGSGWELSVTSRDSGTSGTTLISAAGSGEWEWVSALVDVEEPASPSGLTAEVYDLGNSSTLLIDRMAMYQLGFGTDDIAETDPYTQAGDQTDAIRGLIQDRNSGINLGVSAPVTDQLVMWQPQVDADRDTLEVIDRYVKRDGGVEWYVAYTPLTRTFTVEHPRMGRDIPPEEVTLELGYAPAGNLSGYSLTENATAAVSYMTTLGDGPYRGVSSDLTAWGGLKLEGQQQAPAGTDRHDLIGWSARALRLSTGETEVLTVDVFDGDLIDVIRLGDRVTVVIDDWDVQVDGIFRVVERKLIPKTDSMVLTLNPEPET